MINLVIQIFIVVFSLSFMVFLGLYLNSFQKFLGLRELSSPYECGFDGKSLSRVPFSLRFFLILVLFLIFDIEVVLVLQFPFFKISGSYYYFLSLKCLMVVLLFGTMEEWRRGFFLWVCEKIVLGSIFS